MILGEKLDASIATAAVASPWWLPWLKQVSEVAALALPILGVVWLAVQIYIRITNHRQPKG